VSAGVLDHSLVTKPRVIEGYDRIGDRRTRGTYVSSYGHYRLRADGKAYVSCRVSSSWSR